jgi:hypothetical protein
MKIDNLGEGEEVEIGVITAPEDCYVLFEDSYDGRVFTSRVVAFKTILTDCPNRSGIAQLIPICDEAETSFLEDEEGSHQIKFIGTKQDCIDHGRKLEKQPHKLDVKTTEKKTE